MYLGERSIRKMKHSCYITLPKHWLKLVGLKKGDRVKLYYIEGNLVIKFKGEKK